MIKFFRSKFGIGPQKGKFPIYHFVKTTVFYYSCVHSKARNPVKICKNPEQGLKFDSVTKNPELMFILIAWDHRDLCECSHRLRTKDC